MAKQMLTLTREPSRATLESVKEDLGLSDEEVDADFGLVEIDPDAHQYAILVEAPAAERAAGKEGVEGPFANPPIEPFGPPEGRSQA
jgi:hypothetical protein